MVILKEATKQLKPIDVIRYIQDNTDKKFAITIGGDGCWLRMTADVYQVSDYSAIFYGRTGEEPFVISTNCISGAYITDGHPRIKFLGIRKIPIEITIIK